LPVRQLQVAQRWVVRLLGRDAAGQVFRAPLALPVALAPRESQDEPAHLYEPELELSWMEPAARVWVLSRQALPEQVKLRQGELLLAERLAPPRERAVLPQEWEQEEQALRPVAPSLVGGLQRALLPLAREAPTASSVPPLPPLLWLLYPLWLWLGPLLPHRLRLGGVCAPFPPRRREWS
jgi:hypothetical protein